MKSNNNIQKVQTAPRTAKTIITKSTQEHLSTKKLFKKIRVNLSLRSNTKLSVKKS